MDESVKKVAITFDDGPNPDYTEMLLAGLKERGVSATFFLLGKEVEQYPEIVKKIHEGGHLIGTHSYEHVNLSNLTDAAAIEQVDKTNAAIHEIIGEFPEYIRPPFGCWKPNLDYETTMIEVLWDVDPKDWATRNASVIAQRVLGDVGENDITLLHDASESSVLAAFKIIDELKAQGRRRKAGQVRYFRRRRGKKGRGRAPSSAGKDRGSQKGARRLHRPWRGQARGE